MSNLERASARKNKVMLMPGIETAARRHQNIIRASSKERKKTITTESHFKQIRWENFFDFFSHARASLNARIYGSAWWSAKRWINPSTIDHRLTWATPGKIMKKSCTWWISKLKYRVRFKTISSGGRCLTNTIRICDHCECCWCCIPWNRILTNPAKNTFQYFIPAHGKKTV